MNAPDECPVKPGGYVCWCRSDFCGGVWLVVNDQRRIMTQFMEPWSAVHWVKKRLMDDDRSSL